MNRPITSASNLHRRKTCPGSERLEAALPPEPDSADSSEGTDLHTIVSLGFTKQGVPEGNMPDDHRYCIDFCLDTAKEITNRIFGSDTPRIFTELELHLNGEVFGHADFVAIWKDRAVVLDYKFGRIPVDAAEENMQTRAYAVMISERFGVESVIAGIIQPRLSGEERVSLSSYAAGDFIRAGEEISEIREACKQPDAPLHADLAACRYCRARATCPALEAVATSLASVDANEITATNAADIYRRAKLVEKYIDSIKSKVFNLVQNAESENREVPGIKLKLGSEKRTITDAQKAFVVSGLDAGKFAACCKVNISSLDAAYKEATGMKAKAAKDSLNDLLTRAGVLEKKRSESSLELMEAE